MVNFTPPHPQSSVASFPKGREVQEQEAEVPAADRDRRSGDHEREHPGGGEGQTERQEPESRQGKTTTAAAGALNNHTACFEAQNAPDHFRFRTAIDKVENASAGEVRGTRGGETTCSKYSGNCETAR